MIYKKHNLHHIFDIETSEGFKFMYKTYAKKMCAIAYKQLQDKQLAEDIVHNIFKSIWERRNLLVIKGPIENYLVRAVKLAVLDHIRTKINHQKHLDSVALKVNNIDNSNENLILFNDLKKQIDLLIEKLPAKCKEVFKLSRVTGLKNKEIASKLLISEKTVEAHLSKSLKFIKTKLPDYKHLTKYSLKK